MSYRSVATATSPVDPSSGLGDAHQAVSFYERALAMQEQVHKEEPNHPETAATWMSLGNACYALGDARQAVSFLERALAMYEQVYEGGANHPEIAATLNNSPCGSCLT